MQYQDAIKFGGEITFGAAAAAFLIRYGIRSYFRAKHEHLAQLMQSQDYEQNEEKEK